MLGYVVPQRTREIGSRLAVGAQPGEVLRLVLLQQGMWPSLLGIAIGLGIAWGVMRLLAGSLFEIAPHDADTFIAASTLLVLVALAATYIPARRAMKVDPMAALRHE